MKQLKSYAVITGISLASAAALTFSSDLTFDPYQSKKAEQASKVATRPTLLPKLHPDQSLAAN